MAGQEHDQPLNGTAKVADKGAETAPESTNKPAAGEEGKDKDVRSSAIDNLKPGMQVKGRVRSIVEFGAFIDIGVGRDGLAHISTLKKAGIDKTIKVGDVLEVRVRRVDPEDNRISLVIPQGEEEAKTSLRDLQVGAVVTGRVVRLVDFGAFVDIGAQTDGLLHVSQLGGRYVNRPSEVLNVGDEVQVRILEVDPRKRRISLTMKDTDMGNEAEPEPVVAQESQPGERVPTAFEVAFERARLEQRQRQRRVRK